jgi:hypothetical protein
MITINNSSEKQAVSEKAFSLDTYRINSELSSVAHTIDNLAMHIETELSYNDKLLTKAQKNACEEVAKKLLEKLNKSLTKA